MLGAALFLRDGQAHTHPLDALRVVKLVEFAWHYQLRDARTQSLRTNNRCVAGSSLAVIQKPHDYLARAADAAIMNQHRRVMEQKAERDVLKVTYPRWQGGRHLRSHDSHHTTIASSSSFVMIACTGVMTLYSNGASAYNLRRKNLNLSHHEW
eukprot:2973275-Pyramimonas_sp.AAC.1